MDRSNEVASSTVTPLGYAPRVRLLGQRRVRRTIGGILLIGVIAAGWKWGPAAWERATLLYWQRQCMAYESPADVVLFEPDAVKAAALLRQNVDYEATADRPGCAAFHPRCQRNYERLVTSPMMTAMSQTASGNEYNPVTLFVHQMKNRSGGTRLVIVEGSTAPNVYDPTLDLEFRVFESGTLWSAPKEVTSAFGKAYSGAYDPAVIGVARIDPADPNRFTIPYSFKGESGTIDGRLTDTNSVNFTVRDGPAKKWQR